MLVAVLLSCSRHDDRDEAAEVLRQTLRLRTAPMSHKAHIVERLAQLPCHASDVCAARDACAAAFTHHIQGWRLGTELEAELDAATPLDKQAASARLLEMNIEVRTAHRKLKQCDEALDGLRRTYHLP